MFSVNLFVILISPNRNRKIERHKSVIIPKYIQTVGVLGTAITEIRTYEEEKGNFYELSD